MPSRSIAVACALLAAPCAVAQQPAAYSPPRTSNDRPDLGGVWGTAFLTPLERPQGVKDLVVHPDGARKPWDEFRSHVPAVIDPDFQVSDIRALASVRGELRSSMIVQPADGRLPYSPKRHEARRALVPARRDRLRRSGTAPRPPNAALPAWARVPAIRQLPAFIPSLFVQTPTDLVIATEDVAALRIVHLDGRAPPSSAPAGYIRGLVGRPLGGRYAGDRNDAQPPRRSFPLWPRPPDPRRARQQGDRALHAHVGEKELLYQFTVEDTDLYTTPWLGEYVLSLSDKPWYEYACHEAKLFDDRHAGRRPPWQTAQAQTK